MRIIGGTLKGRTVMPPKGFTARPTTDFAKEGLFNMLENEYDLSSLKVLDLFGGSGSISFEFISRGTEDVICVEMNKLHASFIKKSAEILGISKNIQVVHCNVFDFFGLCTKKFNLIFADPPYAIEGLQDIPDKVLSADILEDGGVFILEHPANYNFEEHPKFKKTKKYGNVHLTFFGD